MTRFHFFKGASEDVPAYIRSTGKGWVNKKGKVSSMPVTGVTTKKRGKKAYLRVNTAEECETECTATAPCVAYTFISMSNRVFHFYTFFELSLVLLTSQAHRL